MRAFGLLFPKDGTGLEGHFYSIGQVISCEYETIYVLKLDSRELTTPKATWTLVS